MPKIGHIAIRSRDCRKAADFFKAAFGFREVRAPMPVAPGSPPPPAVGLTDGNFNLTFLTVPADNVGCDEDFYGIQHIGFVVDDIEAFGRRLESMGAPCILGWDKTPPGAHLEIKYKGPDDVVFDISPAPWPGTPGTHRTGRVKSGDVNLFYRHFRGPGIAGRAPVIIFHGGNYYDSADWVDVAGGLAADRDVLAWDTRGFGETGWSPSKDYSFDAHLGDAVALLDHFNWNKAVVMGHSVGGSYALMFASRLAERTAGLVLVDHCPAAPGGKALANDGTGAKRKVYASAEEALADSSRERAQPGTHSYESFALRLEKVDGGYVTRRDPDFANKTPVGVPDWQTKYPVSDMWQELKSVKAPVLIVRGARSDRFKPEALERLAREHLGVEIAVADSGHDIAAGAPYDLVKATRRFLSGKNL
jgi:pimeloyl-ACP methyl ester carboxylesterase